MKIAYPALFEPQPEGGYTVTFPDLPEAFTEGDILDEACFNAAECLSLVLEVRIEQGDAIPLPSTFEGMGMDRAGRGGTSAALLVHLTCEAEQKSLADLACALGTSWPAVKRLEDPRHLPTQAIGTRGGVGQAAGAVVRKDRLENPHAYFLNRICSSKAKV